MTRRRRAGVRADPDLPGMDVLRLPPPGRRPADGCTTGHRPRVRPHPSKKEHAHEPARQGGHRHRRQQRHRQGRRAGARRAGRQHRHRLRRATPRPPRSWRSRSPRSATRPSASTPTSARSPTCRRLVDTAVEAFGRARHHGQQRRHRDPHVVLDTTEEQYDRVLDINLKSAFFGTQIAAKQMIAQGGGGRIINMTLGARGLADAGQHRLLPVQGRHADAHPDRRASSSARTASRSSASAPAPSPRRSTPRR